MLSHFLKKLEVSTHYFGCIVIQLLQYTVQAVYLSFYSPSQLNLAQSPIFHHHSYIQMTFIGMFL